MIEYLTVNDFSDHIQIGSDITKNGKLMELGADGWDYCYMQNTNGRREWLFKRVAPVIVEPKKRGRPAGTKNKVKDAQAT